MRSFTIHQESRHLTIGGVPALKAKDDLVRLFSTKGVVESCHLASICKEEFTEAYNLSYLHIVSARIAKRTLNNHSFLGGHLSVSYEPDRESVEDVQQKLLDRRLSVAKQLAKNAREETDTLSKEETVDETDEGTLPPFPPPYRLPAPQAPRPTPAVSSKPPLPQVPAPSAADSAATKPVKRRRI